MKFHSLNWQWAISPRPLKPYPKGCAFHIRSGIYPIYVLSLLSKPIVNSRWGNMPRAYQDFEIAFCYAQRRQANQQFLYSGSGIYQAEFFIRLGAWKWFEAVNAWNMEICEEEHWNQHLALCHLLQSWYEICRKRFPQAKAALTQAERILRSSGLVEYVCRLDWA